MRAAKKDARIAGRPGVVIYNVVALRAKADSDSEQVTQALIGEPVIAEGGQGDWLFVQTWDTYRGWIRRSAVRLPDDGERIYGSAGPVAVVRELFVDVLAEPHPSACILTKATISAQLEVVDPERDYVELRLPDGGSGFIPKASARLVDLDLAQTVWLPNPGKLIETAQRFIGCPYLWGGTSPFGIDCSGFVQLVHRIHNITLLRDAGIQAGDPRAEPVARKDMRPGDLIFFARSGDPRKHPELGAITHIGMVIDRDRFIHSSGARGVIISGLDEPEFVKRYWGARRMRLATMDPGGGAPED